jgi:hypothetical protein
VAARPDIGISCYVLGIMLNDLLTAFLVAFAAVAASGLLTRIWEYSERQNHAP